MSLFKRVSATMLREIAVLRVRRGRMFIGVEFGTKVVIVQGSRLLRSQLTRSPFTVVAFIAISFIVYH